MKIKYNIVALLIMMSIHSLSYSQEQSEDSSSTEDNQSGEMSDAITSLPTINPEDFIVDQIFEPDFFFHKV